MSNQRNWLIEEKSIGTGSNCFFFVISTEDEINVPARCRITCVISTEKNCDPRENIELLRVSEDGI